MKSYIARKRAFLFLISDIFLLALSLYLSFVLRFEWPIPGKYLENFHLYLAIFIGLKIGFLWFYKCYRISWIFIGLPELLKLFNALSFSSVAIMGAFLLFRYDIKVLEDFPRSIFFIDYVLSLILLGTLRLSKRVYLQTLRNYAFSKGKKTLIIGAGNAGEQVVRDMKRIKDCPYSPIAFIDDDLSKKGIFIHGIKVLGGRREIPKIVNDLDIELAIIAIPSASSREIREIVSYIRKADLKEIRIAPSINEIISGNITLSDIKEIYLEDLLGREPVEIEYSLIKEYIDGKRVLITGAGGSIGSEIARQISKFHPKSLTLLDTDETALYYVEREIREKSPPFSLNVFLGNVVNEKRMELMFSRFLPEVLFHAAAYKHVPMMEYFPEESVRVNILGTKLIGELALRYGVKKFILISTDKAVNPTSIMGASKRVAEMVITGLDHGEKTKFLAVRFGNVLGSRGSVIPIFEEQIKKGGPVTITDPGMKRYFMTISEAVLLVLQAGAMGKGGEVFVLDMGEPVSIYEVAQELIRLHGLEPEKDIPIVFTGVRPGEKLYEETLTAEEGMEQTAHPKILKAIIKGHDKAYLEKKLAQLKEFSENFNTSEIIEVLKDLVPTYNPNRNIS